MKRIVMLLCIVVFTSMTGCSGIRAPKGEDGNVPIFILSDRGIRDTFTPHEIKQRNQLGDFMEAGLKDILREANYEVIFISRKEEYPATRKTYLLITTVTNYMTNGKRGASLLMRYDLYEQNKPILAKDLRASSDENWKIPVNKLNALAAKQVSARINEAYRQ